MNLLRYTIIGVLGLCIASGNSNDENTEMVTVDAAFGYELNNMQYLTIFVGDKAQILTDHVGYTIRERDRYHVPSNMTLRAAYARPNAPFIRRFFGDKYGINVRYQINTGKFKYGPKRAFLRNGGPDAVGKRAGVVYFFKGCKMVRRGKWSKWGKIKDTSSVGLPCDIHAAWAEQDRMVVLKGDQYWNWEADNSVNGPHDFHSNYTLMEWTLSPAE